MRQRGSAIVRVSANPFELVVTAAAIDFDNHPLTLLLQRAESTATPVSALVELTHACNVDCEHCYLDLLPDSKIGAMSGDEWQRVFRELKASGCLFLTMSGGELLVRKDWFELASYARSLGFALRLYTNGTLIDDRNADRIASLLPLGVEISLLGGIPATHDAIARRRGAFDKTIAGVRRLRDRGVKIVLKCVVMRKNADEMEAIETIARDLGCESRFDVQISPKNDGSTAPQDLAAEKATLVEAARHLAAKMEAGHGFKVIDREARLGGHPCGAGRRTVHVGPTGDVHPCTQWIEPVGNLRTQTFAEVWARGDTFQEIRQKRIADFPVCASCALLDVCAPCMALSKLERGVIDGPSPTKCATAEIKARALGLEGRAAWLASHAETPQPARVRLPILIGAARSECAQ